MVFIVCCPHPLDTKYCCSCKMCQKCHCDLSFFFFPAAMSPTLIPVYLLYLADISKLLQQLLPYIDLQYFGPNPPKQCKTLELIGFCWNHTAGTGMLMLVFSYKYCTKDPVANGNKIDWWTFYKQHKITVNVKKVMAHFEFNIFILIIQYFSSFVQLHQL